MHDFVVRSLGRAIADGRLAGRIDPAEMQERFAVSRSVIRECLRVLEAKGMVRARARHGTHVNPIDSWSVLDPDVISWRAAGSDRLRQLTEIQQIRSALEPQAAALAATRTEPAPLAALARALDALADAAEQVDVDALITADIAFHTCLLVASGNVLFTQLAPLIPAALRLPELADARGITSDITQRHSAVVDAIRAGDAAAAMEATRFVLDQSRELLDQAVALSRRRATPRS